jgi:hypothetical protein
MKKNIFNYLYINQCLKEITWSEYDKRKESFETKIDIAKESLDNLFIVSLYYY